jgi:phage-related protein|nr:MAG TPA: distal tail protein [Caudoviricetes sp.]
MSRVCRVGGFRFNHLLIDNTSNVMLVDVTRPISIVNDGYKYIDVVIGLCHKSQTDRRIKQREILQQIISIKGKLFFLDEPSLYYDAELSSDIEVSETDFFTEITLHFQASACMYLEAYDDMESYTGLPIKLDVTKGSYRIFNFGNTETYPIIQVTGIVQCTIGSYSFATSSETEEVIYIDSKNMVAYSVIDNSKVSKLDKFSGKFPIVVSGENAVTVSGTGKVKILFRDTFIV